MKNLSKLIAVAIVSAALFVTTTAKAQTGPGANTQTQSYNNWSLGIGLETGLPTGIAASSTNFVIGGTANLQYRTSESWALTLTSGYYDLVGEEKPSGLGHYEGFQIIPVKVGAKAFFAPRFYFGAEAGAAFVVTVGGHTKLDLAPALGYGGKSWDFSLRYENISGQNYNYGLVGLRLAYNLPL